MLTTATSHTFSHFFFSPYCEKLAGFILPFFNTGLPNAYFLHLPSVLLPTTLFLPLLSPLTFYIITNHLLFTSTCALFATQNFTNSLVGDGNELPIRTPTHSAKGSKHVEEVADIDRRLAGQITTVYMTYPGCGGYVGLRTAA